jgi:hypothetical protein
MVPVLSGSRAWKPEDSKEAHENYREASGGKTHERWIQGSVTSVRAFAIPRHYESIGGGLFVRPVIDSPRITGEFAAWQAASAQAFRMFEDQLGDTD